MSNMSNVSNLSNIFLVTIALFYAATWFLDLPRLRKSTGREKAIYYTMAVSVFGLYLCSLFQLDVVLPFHWVVYTWSDWLHGVLSV